MPKLSLNIDVGDLEQAVAFYRDGLGLTPVRRLGHFGVEMNGAEVPVFLLHKDAAMPPFRGSAARRDYGRHWTPVHVDFIVGDAEVALARALSAGARAESGVESYSWGRMVLMSDPFGNGFCLIQLAPEAYDSIATPYA